MVVFAASAVATAFFEGPRWVRVSTEEIMKVKGQGQHGGKDQGQGSESARRKGSRSSVRVSTEQRIKVKGQGQHGGKEDKAEEP